MTQRFGGIYSSLSQRDYSELVRILEGGPNKDSIKELDSASVQDIIDIIKEQEEGLAEALDIFRESPFLFEEDNPVEFSTYALKNRKDLVTLQSTRKKLESKLRRMNR